MRNRRLQLVVVEDNAVDVRLLCEALRSAETGVDIHVAGCGEKALAVLRREGPAAQPNLIVKPVNFDRFRTVVAAIDQFWMEAGVLPGPGGGGSR